VFKDADEFQKVQQGDRLRIANLREGLRQNGLLKVENVTGQRVFEVHHGLNQREIEIVLAGGLLNHTRGHFGVLRDKFNEG
jgi:aconitate hydratase